MAGMPQEQAPVDPAGQAPAEGGSEDQFTALVSNVLDGLTMTLDLASSQGSGAAGKIKQASELYKAGIEELMSGAGAGAQQPGSGMVSPEAGGAKAIQAGPGVR